MFKFNKNELLKADEQYLNKLPNNSFDVVFTVSVLDHLPKIDAALKNLIRIAKKRVILIELVFPKEGTFISKKVVPFSYSHDYPKLLHKLSSKLKFKVTINKKISLGSDILDFYQLYVIEKANLTSKKGDLK